MSNTKLDNVINALKTSEDNVIKSAYFGAGTFNQENITVAVQEFGDLSFPLNKDDILKLIDLSEKAKFGLKDQTLHDESVRNTYEIKEDKLSVKFKDRFLEDLIADIKDDLDIEDDASICLHLHNLLIYEKGHFFKTHKDTEKLDNMIASLVVVLPSPHLGGTLVVEHDKEKMALVSENIDEENIQYAVFYADCDHNVEVVKSGYRVALTFNVVLEKKKTQNINDVHNKKFEAALTEYFKNSFNEKFGFMLSHCYSQHGLHWDLLKGSDRAIGHDLLKISEKLDCEIYLTLVNIHESWSSNDYEEDDYYERKRGNRSRYNDDDNEVNYETLEDLIETNITFTHWVNRNDQTVDIGDFSVGDDEIVELKENQDYTPVETEKEGYMGNYGGTVDLWYERAAIVMWPKSLSIKFDFRYNKEIAIKNLIKLTRSRGHEEEVIETIHQVGNDLFFSRIEAEEINDYLVLAHYVNNEKVANTVLERIKWFDLSIANLVPLARVFKLYGKNFTNLFLDKFLIVGKSTWNTKIFTKLLNIVEVLKKEGLDQEILVRFGAYNFESIKIDDAYPAHQLEKHARSLNKKNRTKIEELIKSNFLSEVSSFPVIDHILTYEKIYFIDILHQILKSQSAYLSDDVKKYFKTGLLKKANMVLKLPEPIENDYAMFESMSCHCACCQDVQKFLQNSKEQEYIVSIAQAGRFHIMDVVKKMYAPISMKEIKQGSPHKLHLQKTRTLYKENKDLYDVCLEIKKAV